MKLDIEKWLENQEVLTENQESLFREAIACYKARAYKAATIMTHTALKMVIRDRLLSCQTFTDKYTSEIWKEQVVENLEGSPEWENEVDCLIISSPENKVFIINFEKTESAIASYGHWRCDRDCIVKADTTKVHGDIIISFWASIIEDLYKFNVLSISSNGIKK